MAEIQLARGRLVNARTRFMHQFLVNPSSVSVSHGWSWGTHTPLGMSHPVYSGGQGEEKTISFQLILDGDRARQSLRKAGIKVPLSVSYEIEYYQSLVLPEQPPADGSFGVVAGSTPPLLVLSLGTMFRRVLCLARSVSAQVTLFSSQLDPVQATVDLSLCAYVRQPQWSGDLSGDVQDEQDRAQLPNAGGL